MERFHWFRNAPKDVASSLGCWVARVERRRLRDMPNPRLEQGCVGLGWFDLPGSGDLLLYYLPGPDGPVYGGDAAPRALDLEVALSRETRIEYLVPVDKFHWVAEMVASFRHGRWMVPNPLPNHTEPGWGCAQIVAHGDSNGGLRRFMFLRHRFDTVAGISFPTYRAPGETIVRADQISVGNVTSPWLRHAWKPTVEEPAFATENRDRYLAWADPKNILGKAS